MSAEMDRALAQLSIDEEDEPFDMPNLPEFSSAQHNEMSIIGRILNPDCQQVSNVVLDMPRKWQKQGRVRGIALNKERFQFFFKYEHDLQEVLDKGVQTHNGWVIVLERWTPNPPADFLQYVPIWVQIRNLPMDHYTEAAAMGLGERLGQVKEVAMDLTKSQSKDYVRVKILFDVSRPLRKSKVINLPSGAQSLATFAYEWIQYRCHNCQRLTHEKNKCPLLQPQSQTTSSSIIHKKDIRIQQPIISPEDPLYGLIHEHQVIPNKATGRPKIVPEVLEEMRRYLLADTGDDKKVKEARLLASIKEAEKSIITQKMVLGLEKAPTITKDVDKGKGHIFEFESDSASRTASCPISQPKLLAASIKAHRAISAPIRGNMTSKEAQFKINDIQEKECSDNVMLPHLVAGVAGSSGIRKKRQYIRRAKPSKSLPSPQDNQADLLAGEDVSMMDVQGKRKAILTGKEVVSMAKRSRIRMVPEKGPSQG